MLFKCALNWRKLETGSGNILLRSDIYAVDDFYDSLLSSLFTIIQLHQPNSLTLYISIDYLVQREVLYKWLCILSICFAKIQYNVTFLVCLLHFKSVEAHYSLLHSVSLLMRIRETATSTCIRDFPTQGLFAEQVRRYA